MTTESTPLLPAAEPQPSKAIISPFRRLLLTSLLLSISFVCTVTPLLYSFRVFTCDEYYADHPPYEGTGDPCSRREIESATAKSISLMITLTTVSGVLNLLTTSYFIKKRGVRFAMVCQTLFPGVRNLCQTYAIYIGSSRVIWILQWTQVVSIFGGLAGYMLCANNYVAALVLPEERTPSFGIIQGTTMLGTAIGFSLGGVLGDVFSLITPFYTALCLFTLSTLLCLFFLPYIPPTPPSSSSGSRCNNGIWSFVAPLRVFVPRAFGLETTGTRKEGKFWGLTMLGLGAFLSVLATAYVPLLLQLDATNRFGFRPSENGYLMSANSLSRALFLTLVFPRLITFGRTSYSTAPPLPLRAPPLPTTVPSFEPPSLLPAAEEPPLPPPPTTAPHGSHFDLLFLRCSILLDALLTSLVGFSTSPAHIYLAAIILPLASGTAPAAKGVVMEMVEREEEADALSGIALIETLATVVTVSVFGAVFAALSEIGKAQWVFGLNAATAAVATFVLMLVSFPPGGSKERV